MIPLFFMSDTYYFSHDYNARNDEKIKRLLRKHGMLGYGIFWAIIEDLYQNANAMRSDCEGIAYDLHTHSEVVHSVLHDFDLFIHDGDMFSSDSISKRMEQRNIKSIKARESARLRWTDANAMRTHSERNAIKESKGKESKVKETNIKSDIAARAAPTIEQVQEFALTHGIGSHNAPQDFHDYYTSNGWKVGRSAMKDWKAAYRRWTRNEKNFTHDTNSTSNHKGISSRRDFDIEAIRNWGKEFEQGGGGFPDIFGSA